MEMDLLQVMMEHDRDVLVHNQCMNQRRQVTIYSQKVRWVKLVVYWARK